MPHVQSAAAFLIFRLFQHCCEARLHFEHFGRDLFSAPRHFSLSRRPHNQVIHFAAEAGCQHERVEFACVNLIERKHDKQQMQSQLVTISLLPVGRERCRHLPQHLRTAEQSVDG